MAKFPAFFEIKKALQDLKTDKRIKIVILRNFTLEPLEIYLSYLGIKDKYNIDVNYSDFDNTFQNILEGTIFKDAQISFYFFSLEHLLKGFPYKYISSSVQEIKELEAELAEEIIRNIRLARQKSNIPLVIFLPSSSATIPINLLGEPNNKLNISSNICERLIAELVDLKNIYFEDMARLTLRFGEVQTLEKERKFTTSSLYNLDGLGAIATQSYRYIRTIIGGTKKVVVLDCDNTLWGGILGEDDLDSICLGDEGKGKAYKLLQYYFKSLNDRGVILCIASKNNEKDVFDVFDKNTNMVLTRKNISAWKINWNSKVTNIKEIAEQLNLGLDSFIFVDDSDYELGLVQQFIPEITCVKCEHDYPLGAVEEIIEKGYFDTFNVTDQDRERIAIYRSESLRTEQRKTIVELDEYLKELRIELFVSTKVERVMDRLSQLTLRTNQFNLTTKRYNVQDFKELIFSNETLTLYLSAKDKFGSLGIVALSSATITGTNAYINLFLMSCRAIGRKFESVLLEKMMSQLQSKGVKYVNAVYIQTQKNFIVANFYDEHQFKILGEEFPTKKYFIDLAKFSASGVQSLFKIETEF